MTSEKQNAWIYALHQIDHDNQECTSLEKGGMTQNVTERLEFYQQHDPNFDEDYKVMGVVHFDIINFGVDQELGKILLGFINNVIIDTETPDALREFYINFCHQQSTSTMMGVDCIGVESNAK